MSMRDKDIKYSATQQKAIDLGSAAVDIRDALEAITFSFNNMTQENVFNSSAVRDFMSEYKKVSNRYDDFYKLASTYRDQLISVVEISKQSDKNIQAGLKNYSKDLIGEHTDADGDTTHRVSRYEEIHNTGRGWDGTRTPDGVAGDNASVQGNRSGVAYGDNVDTDN